MHHLSTNIFDHLGFAFGLYNKNFIHNYIKFDKEDILLKIDYHQNNYRYRDLKDIVEGSPCDILAIGCSQTFGVGVPEEYIWSSIIEKTTGMKVANLGICGGSAEQIAASAISYLNIVGKPKYIFAFMPDCLRYFHTIDRIFYKNKKDHFLSKKDVTYITSSQLKTMDFETGELYLKDSVVKFPAVVEDIIPPHEAIKQYVNALYILTTMCKLLDIKFVWSTWNNLTDKIFEEVFFASDEFCINRDNFFTFKKFKNCGSSCSLDDLNKEDHKCNYICLDQFNIKIKDDYKILWHFASDKQHMGIHNHAHVAQGFLESIK
jgi:hypothetical protein